jgi:hypothetical protein
MPQTEVEIEKRQNAADRIRNRKGNGRLDIDVETGKEEIEGYKL